MTNNHGLIFASVKSKTQVKRNDIRGWDYLLSNGATMFLPNPNLQIGSWNFFEVSMDRYKNMSYVSHCPLVTKDGESVSQTITELKLASHEVSQFWTKLEAKERACIMRELGICLTGVGSASAAIGGATAIATAVAEECLFSALTGGLSLVISGGLAGLSWLQYEELKKALDDKMKTVSVFRSKRARLATLLDIHCPAQYKHLPAFDPQVQGLATRMRLIFEDFKVTDLWEEDEDSLEWSMAVA